MRRFCLALVASALMHSSSLACSTPPAPPDVEVSNTYDTVAVVRVTSGDYISNRGPKWMPWRASARLSKVIEGQSTAQTFNFAGGGHNASCGDESAPPRVGDLWVLYLLKDGPNLTVAASYPLSLVRPIDKRFHARVPTQPSIDPSIKWWSTALLVICCGSGLLFLRRRQRR